MEALKTLSFHVTALLSSPGCENDEGLLGHDRRSSLPEVVENIGLASKVNFLRFAEKSMVKKRSDRTSASYGRHVTLLLVVAD